MNNFVTSDCSNFPVVFASFDATYESEYEEVYDTCYDAQFIFYDEEEVEEEELDDDIIAPLDIAPSALFCQSRKVFQRNTLNRHH